MSRALRCCTRRQADGTQHTGGGAGGGAGAAQSSRSGTHDAADCPVDQSNGSAGTALSDKTMPLRASAVGQADTADVSLKQALAQVEHLRRQNKQLQQALSAAEDAKWRRGWQEVDLAPVYTTAKMKAFHREIVDILEDVVVGHKDAMLNAANIWRRGDLVRRSIHDIQEDLDALVKLCGDCVASIETNFNDRFAKASLDMVTSLCHSTVDIDAVDEVQAVAYSAHKGLSERLLKAVPEHVVCFRACADVVLQDWIKQRQLHLLWLAINTRDGHDTVYRDAVDLTSAILKLLWWGKVMRLQASMGKPYCRLAIEEWAVGKCVGSDDFKDACKLWPTTLFKGALPNKTNTVPHACILFPPLVQERTIHAAASGTPTMDSHVVAKGLVCRSVAETMQERGHGGSGYSSSGEASAGACSDVSEASLIHGV